jgi:hypothetical protein
MKTTDRDILRPLIDDYLAVCGTPEQKNRRELWRGLNGLEPARPLVYVRRFAWQEMPDCRSECADPLLASIEKGVFRRKLFWATLNDDAVFEPWITIPAVYRLPGGDPFPANPIKDTQVWGPEFQWLASGAKGGAGRWIPPLKDTADLRQMVAPRHIIDEEATRTRVEKIQDAIGDIIPITVDRGPAYKSYLADISTHLALLRGLEQMMFDMTDNAAWLHRLLAFMRNGILAVQDEAEKAGDWCRTSGFNQAETYSADLPAPLPNENSVARKDLWAFCAAQEFALVGPEMFDEFLLQYQIPILKNFGLVHYGCCEVLTHKIEKLRQIPNLRRIGIGLNADVAACAEQIGTDYVLSYRPSPAEMVSFDFDPDRVKKILKNDLSAARGCAIDITLKDVETVEGDPERVRRWVQIVRTTIEELGM